MKKILSIACIAAFLGAAIGCGDTKTTAKTGGTTTVVVSPAGSTTK